MKIKARIDRMVNTGNVKAIASVSLDGMFVVKNLKVMDGKKGFFEWGIRFEKPLQMEDRGSRPVHYAGKAELEKAILSEYPLVYSEETLPAKPNLKAASIPEKTELKT